MKTLLSILLCLLSPSLLMAQASSGRFQIRGGYGIAVYGTEISYGYDDGNFSLRFDTTDGAATTHIPLELRYDINKTFNAGIDFKFGRYLYASSDDQAGKSNAFRTVGIGADINLYYTDNARVFAGLGAHRCRLETNEVKANGLSTYTETITWRGPGFSLKLGTLYFFGNSPIGIQLNLGYDYHHFKLQSIEHAGATQDLSHFFGDLKVKGIELNGGLVVRL